MRMLKFVTLAALVELLVLPISAVNTRERVEQVAGLVTLSDDVDYIVTSPTPFTEEGVVNIANTEHAVLILESIKPSKLTSAQLASHVQINGVKAVNNSNCQVKMYNRGCIVMPYDKDIKPLTVYSEQNFEGDICNDFGLESTNGFMNTLTKEKLNNRIRSFKLKRGYMVTFSLKSEGYGYSRCFIADDADLEMATLPAILDRSISSYRVFKWHDAGKPQLAAAGGDDAACSSLNVTSTYSWNQGTNMLPDVECASHQIYTGYPSLSSCGNVSYTCHLKTSNEPRNSSDDHPEDLASILRNWEGLMRTGMRLCSPSSWDGSDYWNGTGFLKEFFDSIDARGWRCDILDMHCYWAESNFGNLKNWINAVHRPIWISEWCWGASWNNNGAFANGVTQNQVRDALQRICNTLNGMDYVERYFYWNGERDISKIYKGGSLTPAGQMYSKLDGGLAYNGKYDYVPKVPKQLDPTDFSVFFNREEGIASFTWLEFNGEMNEYIHLERRKTTQSAWEVVYDVPLGEAKGTWGIFNIIEAEQGWEFRISEKDANGRIRNTKSTMCASADMRPGDVVEVDGKTKYLGGNLIMNGNFDLGLYGWTNGLGQQLSEPWFQALAHGNSNNGPYLQCYGNGSMNSESAVKTIIPLQTATDYFFIAESAGLNQNTNQLIASPDGDKTGKVVALLDNTSMFWNTKFSTFNSEDYPYAILSMRSLGCKARFAYMMLCQLFETPEEAVADGLAKELLRFEAVQQLLPQFSDALALSLSATVDDKAAEYKRLRQLVQDALAADRQLPQLKRLWQQAQALTSTYPLPGHEQLEALCARMAPILTAGTSYSPQWVLQQLTDLQEAMDIFMPMEVLDDVVQNPTFIAITGWDTKTGTYQGGTQNVGKDWDPQYWSALWKIPQEGNESETMGISQTIKGVTHGLYSLECQAATYHFSCTDQHGYITDGTDSLVTPILGKDYFDLGIQPWDTLTTSPLYISQNGTFTIGFTGSKQGAHDLAWRELGNTSSQGDHREGSWAATGFTLRYLPLFIAQTTPQQWGVACLPRAVGASESQKYYQIVGITSDFSKLCLEEIAETEPGVPFMYLPTGETSFFLEHGETTNKTTDAPGNLRGFLTSTARVPVGYYILTDGVWQKWTDSANRPRIGNNTAIMRPFTDKQSRPLSVVASWNGPTVSIQGITDEEREAIAADITEVSLSPSDASAKFYDLSGRRLYHRKTGGLYFKVVSGKITKKVIQRYNH